MTARHAGILGEWFPLRVSGWIVSLCVHGSIIFLTGLLVAKIGLAPPSTLFHWDVTVVSPQASTATIPAALQASVTSSEATKPNVRSTHSSAAGNRRPVAPPQAAPARPTPAETTEYRTADSVLPPLHQDSLRAPEHIATVPLDDQQKSARDETVQNDVALMPAETVARLHSPEGAPALLDTDPGLTSKPPPPSANVSVAPSATTTSSQVASLPPSTSPTPTIQKPDYGWLADPLLRRIETLKQYPALARVNHLEGRVVVRIVIEEDGRIASVEIAKSSGHDVLDQAAMETLRQASPIALSRPLEKSPVTMHIPLSYRLGR